MGLAVAAFGVAVAGGIYGQVSWLVHIERGRDASMSLQSAACLVLAGLALMWLPAGARGGRRVSAALAMALVALATVVLAENLLDVSLGLDLPRLYTWLAEPALRPGRMPPNACVGFMLFGAAVLAWPAAAAGRHRDWLRGLTALVFLVAVTGLAAYFIHIEAVITYHGIAAMAPYTGGGLIALGIGLWLATRAAVWRIPAPRDHSAQVITVAAVVLIVVLAVAGMFNFGVLWHQLRDNAVSDLVLRRDERQHYVAMLVAAARRRGREFALEADRQWPQGPAAAPSGISAYRLLDRQGHELAGYGMPMTSAIAVHLAGDAFLLWSNGFYLLQREPIRRQSEVVGTVVVEQQVPLLASIGVDTAAWGASGEMGLCGYGSDVQSAIECFPQRLRPEVHTMRPDVAGMERPMALALGGHSGVALGNDYRGQRALSAYAPIPGLHLGLVVKMDTEELFNAMRSQLEWMTPLVLGLILGGLEVLYWQLRPLLRELVESRNQAIASEARFRAAAESSQDAFYIYESLREPERGQIVSFQLLYANRPGQDLNGLDPVALLAADGFFDKFRRVVNAEQPLDEEVALAQPHGRQLWLQHQCVPLGDGVAVTLRDISQRKHTERRLIALAESDPLTGLANRSAFLRRLEHAMETARRRRDQSLLALLFLDIDRFKQINDTRGHAAGDSVLQAFAQRLRGCVRAADTVARLGGDEFTVLLESLDQTRDADLVVEVILTSLERAPLAALPGEPLTTSIGVTLYRGEAMSAEELLEQADAALYAAKRAGGNVSRKR